MAHIFKEHPLQNFHSQDTWIPQIIVFTYTVVHHSDIYVRKVSKTNCYMGKKDKSQKIHVILGSLHTKYVAIPVYIYLTRALIFNQSRGSNIIQNLTESQLP